MSFSVTSGNGVAPGSIETASDGSWSQGTFQAGTVHVVTPRLPWFRFAPSSRQFSEGATDLNLKRKK